MRTLVFTPNISEMIYCSAHTQGQGHLELFALVHNLDLTWIELNIVLCFQCVFSVFLTCIDAGLGSMAARDVVRPFLPQVQYMVANMHATSKVFILGTL
jgi:hypothetical protein